MAIERAGETFSGYNKPKNSRKGGKKFAVLAKEGDKIKLIRFGDPDLFEMYFLPMPQDSF